MTNSSFPEAPVGIEPTMPDLQSGALPLGDGADHVRVFADVPASRQARHVLRSCVVPQRLAFAPSRTNSNQLAPNHNSLVRRTLAVGPGSWRSISPRRSFYRKTCRGLTYCLSYTSAAAANALSRGRRHRTRHFFSLPAYHMATTPNLKGNPAPPPLNPGTRIAARVLNRSCQP